MLQTLEAITDEQGNVHLLSPVKLPSKRRVLVIVLDEAASMSVTSPLLSNGHAQNTHEEIPADWMSFLETLDEIAEEDDMIDARPTSMTEEFLQSRR